MKFALDTGIAGLAKKGEELCGDVVEIKKGQNSTVVVLSDGLGSGVKANILATLTSKIAANLLAKGVSLPEVVHTITETLPVCQTRKIAYSTFTVIQIDEEGRFQATQVDNPPVLLVRKSEIIPLTGKVKNIAGRNIMETSLELSEGDIIILVSDGVTHAGIGALLPLGLGIDGLIKILGNKINLLANAQEIAEEILEHCETFSALEPGDDITVVVLKLRKPVRGIMLSGPPLSEKDDSLVVEEFFAGERRRVVCGGTTANIVARERQVNLAVDYFYDDPLIPPTGSLPGVDLVTEGIITLTKVVELLEKGAVHVKNKKDGASRLLKWLLECDEIELMVGLRVNPAHMKGDLPFHLGLRATLLQRLAGLLSGRGKRVHIKWV
ncbi:MAG: Stage sporulation protein (SpoIIE) [Peptococcaceae bacterium]|nr:Stage sporulation protein (SpoIIE) [Peptococcaceae bacterium]